MVQRDVVQRIRLETDTRRKLALYGGHLSKTMPRSVPVQLLARAAAASDPGAAGVWEQMLAERLTGMTYFAQNLHEQGHLRGDVSLDDARDILWTYIAPELYELLVIRRGWSPDRYGRWVAGALIAALLP